MYAQGVGTGPLSTSSLPVSGTLTLAATLLGLIAIGYWALRKKSNWLVALAGPALLMGAGAGLITSPELRADLPFIAFTSPAGEYIDVSESFAQGQWYFEFKNQAGTDLKVVRVQMPNLNDCPPYIGKPEHTAAKPTQPVLEGPSSSACVEGKTLAVGELCSLDLMGFCPLPD
jgi:hypothetical protein